MTLTKEQIDQLFLFTEKKLVRYYDVQIELVDHLAERIEEECTINSKLSFDNALQKVYADFGIFGFAKIVAEKEKGVLKQTRKIWWKEILNFVQFPKIAFTAFLFIACYQLTQIIPFSILTKIILPGFMVYVGVSWVNIFRLRSKETKKVLLMQANPAIVSSIIPLMEYSIFYRNDSHTLLFCFAVVLSVILQHATNEVYKKVRLKARALYPEAFAIS